MDIETFNAIQREKKAEFDAGYAAGGPVDESRSINFQYGQLHRIEQDALRTAQSRMNHEQLAEQLYHSRDVLDAHSTREFLTVLDACYERLTPEQLEAALARLKTHPNWMSDEEFNAPHRYVYGYS